MALRTAAPFSTLHSPPPARFNDEVVEDSEPERERRRKGVPLGRRHRRLGTIPKTKPGPETIDLTSSESDNSFQTSRALCNSSPKNPVARKLSFALNQFAYQTETTRASPSFNSTAAIRKEPSNNESTKATTSLSRKKGRLIDLGLSESEISRLGKCVCCDIRWTTRKTTIQKLNHIQTCSKKHSFTPETIRVLIRKELDKTVGGDAKEAIASTRLEDLVGNALPKKKGKRKKTKSTVQEYSSEKREAMLKRARIILGPTIRPEGEQGITNLMAPIEIVQLISPPCISTLDRHIPGGASAAPESLAPHLPTLKFLPSKLRYQVQRNLDDILLSPNDPSKRDGILGDDYTGISALPVVDGSHPRLPEETLACEVSQSSLNPDNLHESLSVRSGYPSSQKKTKSARGRSPAEAKSKHKGEKPRYGDASYEQWQADFQSKIMQDNGLYHQILRYEPIHFDIFERLAPGNGSGVQRRQKILAFLDNKAINFYGYRPQKQRRHRSTS